MTPGIGRREALRFEHVIVLVLAVCSLALVWAFPYFPTQEGPLHLYNANSVRTLLTNPGTILDRYYELDPMPRPGWLADWLLVLLMSAVPPLVAEKLLLTAYALCLPLTVWYAARPARGSSVLALVLSFAFVFNFPLYMGLYGFVLGLPLLFFAIGWWLRHRPVESLRAAATLSVLLLALFFTDPLSLVLFFITVVILSIWLYLLPGAGTDLSAPLTHGAMPDRTRGRAIIFVLAALPVLVLLSLSLRTPGEGEALVLADLAWKAKELFQLSSLNALRRVELDLSRALAGLVAGLAIYVLLGQLRRRSSSRWDGMLLAVGAAAAAYLGVPGPSAAFLYERLGLLIGLLTVLWIGGQALPRGVERVAIATFAAIAIGFFAVRMTAHARLNAQLREYVAASELVDGISVLGSVGHARPDDAAEYEWRTDPFFHVAAYLTLDEPAVLLADGRTRPAHAPIRFRQQREPFGPRALDSARVDLLLVWEDLESIPAAERAVVERRYQPELAAENVPYSIYRRRASAAAVEAGAGWRITELSPAPVARYESAATVIGDRLYVFGGFDSLLVARQEVFRFDPGSDRWDRLRDMPVGFNHANAVYDGRYLWFAGGFVGRHPGLPTTAVWKYDVGTDEWTPGPPLPAPRAGGGLALIDGRLHYFGGFDHNQYPSPGVSDHWSLDLTRSDRVEWSVRAPLPRPRGHFGVAVLRGRIYVVGGTTPHDPAAIDYAWTHAYDPSTDSWEEMSSLPGPRSHIEPSTFVWDGRIVVVGGFARTPTDPDSPRDVSAEVTAYDPVEDTWESLATLPTPLMAPVAQPVANRLVIAMGGAPPHGWDNLQDVVFVAELPTVPPPGPEGR